MEEKQSDPFWQTRNVDGELKFQNNLDQVVVEVLGDPTIWKISYHGSDGQGVLRLLKQDDGTWKATFQSSVLGSVFVPKLETE